MNTRPTHIDISYMRLEVVEREHYHPRQDLGTMHYDQQVISVRAGMAASEEANTLLHECLHAIFYAYGISMPHEQEEAVVNTVANGLCELIKRNPELVEYLVDRLTDKE